MREKATLLGRARVNRRRRPGRHRQCPDYDPGADATTFAKDNGDRMMEWLQKAVQAGYKDAANIMKHTNLDALRPREDFKKLIAELEANAEKQ